MSMQKGTEWCTELLALKTEDMAGSQGMWAPSRSMSAPLELPEGTQPCQLLDFNPVKSISDFWPPEL